MKTAASEALDLRREIRTGIHDELRVLPETPFAWADFDAGQAFAAGAAPDPRLVQLSRIVCNAPARTAELRSMWNECVITAAFAWRLAPHLGSDADSCAIAGLLHRMGDLLTLRALGAVEYATRLRIDAAGKAELSVELGEQQLERVVRAWRIPPRAASTAAEWRRLRDFPAAAADATTVYLSRLLALELISPQFCAPGVLDHAVEEARVNPAVLSRVRADRSVPMLLVSLATFHA
jgi:hypothetical protein